MRCPWCGKENDRVVDSRTSDRGAAIRRRRECLSCRRRYTTFERIEDLGLMVVKRDGSKEPYDRGKVVAGISKALTNRPVTAAQVQNVASRIEERLRRKGPVVTTEDVGLEVLAMLAKMDQVAYLRFASVYKDFQQAADFERELGTLQKREPAKRRAKA
ncbi:MAG TPA: transcriptional regulator NrdR [Actinomycetota bacterium]|nr:transcriptional regulator NrdR [Actinomycetota bacterium]